MKENKREGKGMMFYNSGDKYEGEYKMTKKTEKENKYRMDINIKEISKTV